MTAITVAAAIEASAAMAAMEASSAVIEERMVPAAVIMLFPRMVDDKARRIAPASPERRRIAICGVAIAESVAIVGPASDRGAGDDAKQNERCDRADWDEGSLW